MGAEPRTFWPLQLPVQVKATISFYTISMGDLDNLASTKPLVFLLDDLPSDDAEKKKKKKKKEKKLSVNYKNFGARVNANTMKQSTAMTVGWRCRPVGLKQTFTPLGLESRMSRILQTTLG